MNFELWTCGANFGQVDVAKKDGVIQCGVMRERLPRLQRSVLESIYCVNVRTATMLIRLLWGLSRIE